MMLRRADLHTLAGPYALDSLSGPERQRFEAHLAGCGACQEEAHGLREAAAQLAAVTAAGPPPQLRGRVLAAAATARQLPPAGLAGAGDEPAASGQLARRAAFSPVLVPRLAVAVGGAFTLLALALGSLAVTTQHNLGVERSHSQQIAMIMNAPDATMMTVTAAHGRGSATVMMSHRARSLVLTTVRLPGLPHDMAYQVWLMGPSGVRAAGLLPAAHQGMTAPVIVSGLAAHERLELTVEHGPGARHPTSRPVLLLSLP
jgi:Anti-sigma-K factor rskA, C-terminal/Putative zinc-finger